MSDYPEFGKIPRLRRDCTVTEKIDGTNGLVAIEAFPYVLPPEQPPAGDPTVIHQVVVVRRGDPTSPAAGAHLPPSPALTILEPPGSPSGSRPMPRNCASWGPATTTVNGGDRASNVATA